MPSDIMEKTSPSSVASLSSWGNGTADKPRTASQHRKSSKPIMEKRRRARINDSLGQLKTLILDALKKDSSRHSKLEKADILEMTVKHLRNMQRLQINGAVSTGPLVLVKYRDGFSECMSEVTRFLSTCGGVNTERSVRQTAVEQYDEGLPMRPSLHLTRASGAVRCEDKSLWTACLSQSP
ncbi:hypothetical protein UPYG_G00299670 [Umbra pygmaea]|uniref:Uncharacterized protein n=1 Tax=Umbra pygmaea TaxID=75934 RepID=A0ABD0WVU5_UMBPY